jgi:hypothetical protein
MLGTFQRRDQQPQPDRRPQGDGDGVTAEGGWEQHCAGQCPLKSTTWESRRAVMNGVLIWHGQNASQDEHGVGADDGAC